MSLNWKEINKVIEELDLPGSFIQQIIQPGYDTIALYTYNATQGSRTILICLAPGACRFHETQKKIPKNDKPLRFNEFLKKRIKGTRIQSCEQVGQERVIKIKLTNSTETFYMFIRLWSGAANVIVTDPDLKILDVFYRRPKRNEVTGGTFELPKLREPVKDFTIRSFDEINKPEYTFNQKVDYWYSEHGANLSREALLEQAEREYNTHKSRLEAAINRLETKRKGFLTADQWKHQGDLILTYGHLIDGENKYLECIDYDTNATVQIEINPTKNAQENAALYYEKYKKAVSGLSELEEDIQKTKKALLDLETNYETIVRQQNPIKMQQMLRKQTKPRQQIKKLHPGLSFDIKGWHIIVGRTAAENDDLLRHYVKGRDMWLHTRDWPGGYVFIKQIRNKSIPLDILLYAGNLAIFYSKGRKARTCDLYYTEVKYLRRAKNGPKGLVLPTHEKNLTVSLDDKKLKEMESLQNI
ncbi:MAG: hypothetical protein BKP49_04465 [Treponema sp. CETP13]|nr:MAG: hypothetical protein BKP49_04465 [Treponema sp. CETP13]